MIKVIGFHIDRPGVGSGVVMSAIPSPTKELAYEPERVVFKLDSDRAFAQLSGDFMRPSQRHDAIADILGGIALRILKKRETALSSNEQLGERNEEI